MNIADAALPPPTPTHVVPPASAYALTVDTTRELARLASAKINEVRRTYTVTCGLPADGLTKQQMLSAIALEMQKLIRAAVA